MEDRYSSIREMGEKRMENTGSRPLYHRERDRVPVSYEGGLVSVFDCRGVKDFSPSEFDLWIVHLLASRQTDFAIPVH